MPMCEALISLQTLPTFGYNYSTKHSIVSSIRARVKVRRTFSFTLHFFCVALYNEQLIHWYFIHYFYRTIAIIWYGILNAVLSMWSKNGDQKWLPALKVIFFAYETNYFLSLITFIFAGTYSSVQTDGTNAEQSTAQTHRTSEGG